MSIISLSDGLLLCGAPLLFAADMTLSVIRDDRPRRDISKWVYPMVAAAVLVAAPWAEARVFAIVVALNIILGRSEFVPFSTYPMFSEPQLKKATVVLIDSNGDPLDTQRTFGDAPHIVRKTYSAILIEQRRNAPKPSPEQLRRATATALLDELDMRRAVRGLPALAAPVSVALVTSTLGDSGIEHDSSVLATKTPAP